MELTFVKLNDELINDVVNHKIMATLNNKSINLLIKLTNVRLPFDIQKYNNNLYLNIEAFKQDKSYDENIKKISSLETYIRDQYIIDNHAVKNISFISSIKMRSNDHVHIKTMCKRNGKKVIMTVDTIDLYKLKEDHINNNNRYDIEIKPEFIWQNEIACGINFVICSIVYA